MTTELPDGPALVYITTTGTLIPVDREAISERRERRLFRALAAQAGELAGQADDADEEPTKIRTGFQGPGGVRPPE